MTNVQFQSMNKLTQSDDYTITLARKHIEKKIIIWISLLRIETWIHFIQGLFMKSYLKLTSGQCILTLSTIISQWRSLWPFSNLNSLYPEKLCLVEMGPVVKGRMFLNIISAFLPIRYCLLKRALPFTWTNLSPLHPMMLCVGFVGNWLRLVTSICPITDLADWSPDVTSFRKTCYAQRGPKVMLSFVRPITSLAY